MNTELDDRIAREIMGWTLSNHRWWDSKGNCVFAADEEWAIRDWWNPSKRWDHLGLVLGKLAEGSPRLRLEIFRSLGTDTIGAFVPAGHTIEVYLNGCDGCSNGEDLCAVVCSAILEAWGDGEEVHK